MSFRRAATMTGTSLFLFASAALIAVGCGSSTTTSGTGGSNGMGGKAAGGHIGSGGATGAGGATGVGGGPALPTCMVFNAGPSTNPVLFDFTDPTKTSFGDYTTMLSGSLYKYSGAVDLTEISTGVWMVEMDVSDYGNAGLGLGFVCDKTDISGYTGFSFDIAGTYTVTPVAGVDAGTLPVPQVTVSVGTVQDEVTSIFNGGMPTWGTCAPLSGNQYDGSCGDPFRIVALTPGPTLVNHAFKWTEITGGKGQPGGRATPDPTQITGIRWILPWTPTSAPYHASLLIDNIRLDLDGAGPVDAAAPVDAAPPVDSATTD